jgi:hypothetical protein
MRNPFPVLAFSAVLLSLAGSVYAAPVTFEFRFADPDSTAQAVGSITFEDTLVQNPGNNRFELPDPAVLALDVTVTGSANGDGVFGIDDFEAVVFETNGGTLDFGIELVGQPTDELPWGTLSDTGDGGDFNLFAEGGKQEVERYSAPAVGPAGSNFPPNGENYFTLGANGGADEPMVLVTMSVTGGVPASPPATLPFAPLTWLALAGLVGLGGILGLHRRFRRC